MSELNIQAARRVHALLLRRGWTIATAESLTGGALAEVLCESPGSSEVFRGGVVAYATEVKIDTLGVPDEVVQRWGVISAECALAMARGACRVLGADVAVSATGVAGPDSQEGKPVGEVHLAVSWPAGDPDGLARQVDLRGERGEVRVDAVGAALALLLEVLDDDPEQSGGEGDATALGGGH